MTPREPHEDCLEHGRGAPCQECALWNQALEEAAVRIREQADSYGEKTCDALADLVLELSK